MRNIGKIGRRMLLGTVLTASILALSSCGGDEPIASTSADVSADTAITTEAVTETTARPVTVLVEDGKSDYYVINARTASSEVTLATREFISSLEKKTGVKLKLYPESYTETECEILVGMIHDREAALEHMKDVGYTSWSVRLEGKKIVVTAYDEEGVTLALKALMSQIEEREGKWTVPADLDISGDTSRSSHRIPTCESLTAHVAGIYQAASDGIEVCLRGVKSAEYDATTRR